MAMTRTVIELPFHDESSLRRAMTKASETDGMNELWARFCHVPVEVEMRVRTMSYHAPRLPRVVRERNLLVVSGIGVDCVELTNKLRRRFRSARVVSVRTINPEQEAGLYQRDFSDRTFYNTPPPPPPPRQYYYYQPVTYTAIPIHEPDPPSCSIM